MPNSYFPFDVDPGDRIHVLMRGSLATEPSSEPQGDYLILMSNVKSSVYSMFWHK